MGYFFRRSARLGPFRLNFSKSGVGASVGVKGARLTLTPRGTTYVTVGSHGFYYRETLSKQGPHADAHRPAAGCSTKGYKLSVREIDDFLTAKHPRLHTSDSGTIRRLGVPYKVLYRIPHAKAFLRLLSETENQIGVNHLHDFLEKRVRTSKFPRLVDQ